MENRRLSSAFTGPPVFRWLAISLLFTLLAAPANAGSSADWADWYQRSLEWQTGATPLPVPPEGLRLQRGGATWLLESGEIFVMAPAPDGALTGMVFRGQCF